MSANISVFILAVCFVVLVLIRLLGNYQLRKKEGSNSELLGTKDIVDILFNVGLLTAGITAIVFSLGYQEFIFGPELAFAQPIINFLGGILFIWFAIRNMFYGGKV